MKIIIIALIIFIHFVPTVKANSIGNQISYIIKNDPNLKGALIGISIRSASTGEIIYQHNGDTRLTPASSLKLFTAAAALSKLGDNYVFKTEVFTDGLQKGKKLKGNLYMKGKGDPTLLVADMERITKTIYNKGIKVIDGDLIADDSWYDDVRYSVDMPWSDEQTYYGAQVSALTTSPDKDFDAGTINILITPSKRTGEKAQVILSPKTDFVKVINLTKTVLDEKPQKINIVRKHGTNTFTIEGSILKSSKKLKETVSVWDPTNYSLQLFKQLLEAKGIKIKGQLRTGKTPQNSFLVSSDSSIPLSKLMIPFMKLSNNSHAEILVKEMGRVFKDEGSWEKGLEILNEELSRQGINTKTMVIRDGSGISHINLVPANEISKLLFNAQHQEWFPSYIQSLPVSGEKGKMVGGTLRYRMKSPPVKSKIIAKTGTLSTVSSLSGYAKTNSGQTYIFSILLNHLKDEKKGKKFEDKICEILVNN